MNSPRLFFALLAFFLYAAAAGHVFAQDDQDSNPHIQPRKEEKQKRPAKPAATPQPEQQEQPQAAPPEQPPLSPSQVELGESSSKDSLVDFTAGPPRSPNPEPAAAEVHYDPHRASKDLEVGNYYLKQKNYRAASERFRDALLYKPNDAEATYGLAVTQEKMELFSLAYNSYSKYLEILPHGPVAKEAEEGKKRMEQHLPPETLKSSDAKQAAQDISEGEKQLANNQFDAARQTFEHALRLTPENPVISFRLAQSLQGLQQPDGARMYYQKYLELAPKGEFAAEARKSVARINDMIGK